MPTIDFQNEDDGRKTILPLNLFLNCLNLRISKNPFEIQKLISKNLGHNSLFKKIKESNQRRYFKNPFTKKPFSETRFQIPISKNHEVTSSMGFS